MAESDCREELLKAFNIYDTAVDIVSCWESFLTHSYHDEFYNFYFERFPEIPSVSDPLTPDFTAYINNGYGIVGEIKRTFPNDQDHFRKELDQIEKYDSDLKLKTENDGRINPENIDIYLLISGSSAPQIGSRINTLVESGKLSFDNNLVLLRYNYNTTELKSRYEFQRVTELEMGFSDESLPDDISLSKSMGEDGHYETLPVKPDHFFEHKVKKPICNDEPPGHYLATILWNKIFPNYLNNDQFREWQEGSIQKIIDIEDTVTGYKNNLNKFIQDGNIQQSWVRKSLDFLCDAGLCHQEDDSYVVEFTGLIRNVGSQSLSQNEENIEEFKELAYKFVDRYCKYNEDSDTTTQTSFEQFTD